MNPHSQDIWKGEQTTLFHKAFSCVRILIMHHKPVKATYRLRLDEFIWSGCTTSGKRADHFIVTDRLFSYVGMLTMYKPVESNLHPENE